MAKSVLLRIILAYWRKAFKMFGECDGYRGAWKATAIWFLSAIDAHL